MFNSLVQWYGLTVQLFWSENIALLCFVCILVWGWLFVYLFFVCCFVLFFVLFCFVFVLFSFVLFVGWLVGWFCFVCLFVLFCFVFVCFVLFLFVFVCFCLFVCLLVCLFVWYRLVGLVVQTSTSSVASLGSIPLAPCPGRVIPVT